MDLGSTIIGAIVIAICILPLVIISRKSKIQNNKKMKSLQNLANQHDCQISQHEICCDYIIGLDESKNHLFFLKQLKDNIFKHSINLADIQKCRINNIHRNIEMKSGAIKVVDKLELVLVPTLKNSSEIRLEFFDTNVSSQLNGELQSIEKWHKIVNDKLK